MMPGRQSIHSSPLETLIMGYGYKLAEIVSELTPLQREYQLMVWKREHQAR